jgi:hypothetical protein
MTPYLWDFGLTPEQGLKIATIMANWAILVSFLIAFRMGFRSLAV